MNPLLELNQRGQFVWLDHISRSLIRGGELQRLAVQDLQIERELHVLWRLGTSLSPAPAAFLQLSQMPG